MKQQVLDCFAKLFAHGRTARHAPAQPYDISLYCHARQRRPATHIEISQPGT